VVTHQLQVERRTGKVHRPETDVLPLCHTINALAIHTLCEAKQFNGMMDEKQSSIGNGNKVVCAED